MRRLHKTNQSGFTLIELLVVISIIALLSSTIITSVGLTRRKARDSQRVTNMRTLRDALAIFYNDKGAYPNTSGAWVGTACGMDYMGTDKNFVPEYIRSLPKDPACGTPTCVGATSKDFLYNSDGIGYKLIIDGCFETDTYTAPGQPFQDPIRPSSFGAIYSSPAYSGL